MPRAGYKSITVTAEVQEILNERYEKNKSLYLRKYSITSFSGYLLWLTHLEERLNEKHTPP